MDLSRSMVRERGEAKLSEEGVGQHVRERGAVAYPPWAEGTAGGLSRQIFARFVAALRRHPIR